MSNINYIFGHPNLKIVQEDPMFRFSLDSVLLAAFTNILFRTKSILDIGSGNAVIPLILAQRTSAQITGIEIQKEVFSFAQQSVKLNHLESQISLILGDIREYRKICESDQFDIITCNPPYFKLTTGSHLNQTSYKTRARHESDLTLNDVFLAAKKLLKNQGSICLVQRPERFVEILMSMKEHHIEPKRVQFIYPKKGQPANILLIEGRKQGKPGLTVMDPIYIHNEDGTYTEALLSYLNTGIPANL